MSHEADQTATYDVVVIGGGFAGVTAARDLTDAGMTVLIVEGRDRLGGRTFYRRFANIDTEVEFGGTWFMPEWQPNIDREIRRYGLPLAQSPPAKAFGYHVGGQLRASPLPVPPAEIPALEAAIYHIIAGARQIEFGRPADLQSLSDIDIPWTDFMSPLNLPAATSDYINAWASFMFGVHPSRGSALNLLWWIAGFDNSVWRMSSLVDKFARGTRSLIDAMIADAAPEVRTGTGVTAVQQTHGEIVIETNTGDTFGARAAVVAVPLNTLGDIAFTPPLGEAKRRGAREGHAGHTVKPWALVRNVPSNFVGIGYSGGLKWLYADCEIGEGNLLVGFGNIEELDGAETDDVGAAVRHFLPAAEVVATDFVDWNSDPYSKGTATAYRPGQATALMSGLQAPEGRLAFAGADTSSGWFGWIDGAIESGHRAADDVKKMALTRDN